VGSQSLFNRRELLRAQDESGRAFVIPAGAYVNTHVLRLHAADFGFC
jgi:hypothetical protein